MQVASVFNNTFIETPLSLKASLPPGNHNFTEHIPVYNNSFFFTPVISQGIFTILQDMKESSFHTLDFPMRILKKVTEVISPVLAKIFNLCITSGIFPDCLKIARSYPFSKGVTRWALKTLFQYQYCTLSQKFLKNVYLKEFTHSSGAIYSLMSANLVL